MARTLAPDRERASIAAIAALIILFSTASIAQIGAIALGGVAGFWFCRAAPSAGAGQGHLSMPVSRIVGLIALTAFFVFLGGLPVLWALSHAQGVALFDAFYRSGALVFGGGHVVLPLLREATVTPGWVSDDAFLARLWCRAGSARTAFHFRGLPRGSGEAVAARHSWRDDRSDCNLPPRHPGAHGCFAILGNLPAARAGASDDAGRERGGGGSTGCCPLQSGLDEFGQGSGRLRDRACRLRATDRMANAAARRRRHQRARRNSPSIGRIVTWPVERLKICSSY